MVWSRRAALFGGVSFSPLSLFAASEPGFWYDPSDISTLFQDAAGTTPVTAAGQSVGLVLDKSRGLALGPELVTPEANRDFSSDTGYWSKSGTTAISGGVCTIAGAINNGIARNGLLTIGRGYVVSFEVTRVGSGSVYISSGSTVTPVTNTVGVKNYRFVAINADFRIFAGANGTDVDIDNVTVRELAGNHATQSNALQQPTYQVDSNGRGYLNFDGSDDSLVTGTITPGTDKAQVFAGLRKNSNAAVGVLIMHSDNWAGVSGSFVMTAPESTSGDYAAGSRGSAAVSAAVQSKTGANSAPELAVITGLFDIAGDSATVRRNGVAATPATGDQGTGNFSAQVVRIGRYGTSALPFNGRIYGLICRFGPNLTATQITQVENWMNGKTGAY